MRKPIVHGRDNACCGGEFTLCGFSYDAYETGDVDEPVVMASPGELVTCKDCRRQINEAKKFKRYRQPTA